MSERPYRRKCIGVIGSSSVSEEVAAEARKVGALICSLGANLVCGGLGGVMEEACRGFVEERFNLKGEGCGVTVGILPGGDPRDANPFVDIVVPTSLGIARNFLVVQASDILVSVAGGSGTLSELSMAWQTGKTVIAMSETGGWSAELAGKRIDDRRPDTLVRAASAGELEKALKNILG
jgi:uncharacterized protein (TIGR00725 family)